jgi:ABC-type bacteriocin/lantibiotic exporter with double-glycine peptidase domain
MAFNSLSPSGFKFIVDDGLVGKNRTLLIAIITALAIAALLVSAAGLRRDCL